MKAKARRSWHRGLDRDAVITQALKILDSEGRPALTMRRLAADLEVEPASLYAHVQSKQDLIDGVLDRVLDEVELPDMTADWRADMRAGLGTYRQTLRGHAATVLLMTERARGSPSQARLVVRSIETLEGAGLSTRDAVDAHVVLVAYVLGFVLQEVGRPWTMPPSVIGTSLVIERTVRTLLTRSVDERFEIGLSVILDGIAAGVARAPVATRKPRTPA